MFPRNFLDRQFSYRIRYMFFVYAKASVFPRKLPPSPPTLPDTIIHCAKLSLHTLLAYFFRNDLISGKKETDWEIGRRGGYFRQQKWPCNYSARDMGETCKEQGEKRKLLFPLLFFAKNAYVIWRKRLRD